MYLGGKMQCHPEISLSKRIQPKYDQTFRPNLGEINKTKEPVKLHHMDATIKWIWILSKKETLISSTNKLQMKREN